MKMSFSSSLRREDGFSQDAQHRPCKSPRKRLKVARTSLIIDQLKSVFWYPGDFMSRMRTRRNWRPEFLARYLCDNRHGCNRECGVTMQYGERNFVPEAPKIYSIGLRSSVKCLSGSDDPSSSCGAINNFKKRLGIIRRPTVICKYWVAQSIPVSTDVSPKAHTNRQTMTIACTKSTEIIPEYSRTEKSNSRHNQSCEEKESDVSDASRNDRAADDLSFVPGDLRDPSACKDDKCNSSSTTRDAQVQTSSGRSLRRKKIRTGSKPMPEGIISRRKRYDNKPRSTDFPTVRSRSSSRRSYRDESWLRVRVLENKRVEYVNKFTAVNRQIEEITATLRETCCDGENSRDNPENCDEYFSSISDDAKANTINSRGVESSSTIAGRRNASKDENCAQVNLKSTVGEGDRCKNVQKISRVDNLDNKTVSSPHGTIAFSGTSEIIPDGTSGDRNFVRTINETVHSSNGISGNKRAQCRFKRMFFDLNLTKSEDTEPREFSITNESFDKVCLKDNSASSSNGEHARDPAEGLANLEESRYRRKFIEKKVGEVAVLEDIKKRIDRDFDPPTARRDSDAEDFLTASQKGSDRRDVIDVASAATIEASESVPLIASTNLDPTETEIHSSVSNGAISEYSNENSALSKYFSCTRIPSLVSLTRYEDELAVETAKRDIIARDSHSNLHHSSYHCYDARSNSSLNDRSSSNLDSSLDRSSLEYVARCDSSAQHVSPDKLPIGTTANEPHDTFEISEGRDSFAEYQIREWERPPLGESKRKEWRAEKRCTADSTLETSKSSRCVGSIDSGVFSSSLIDLYPVEAFRHVRTKFKKKRRAGEVDGSSAAVDSGSDSSCTDDTLDRKVNDVVRDLTKNLILCERKARMKLRARDARYSRACKSSGGLFDTCCDFFNSPQRSSEDERIVSISTPSLLSLSDGSEIEDCESRRRHDFC